MASLHLQHMSHPHVLNRVTLTEHNCFLCPICSRQTISGEAYCCEGCQFYVHKSCAEVPPRINHPFHPLHPLVFKHGSNCRTCRTCNCLFYFTYSCDSCDFHLDVSCTIATLPAGDPHSSHDMKTIRHIAHEHPLTYFDVGKTSISCQGCKEWISGETCGCRECSFLLHKKCAEAPSEIRHPFHPQHPLSLSFDPSSEIKCKGCLYPFKFAYKCRECSYALDLLCASSTLEQEQRYESVSVENFAHPHGLRYFYAGGNTSIMCMFCEGSVFNEFYGCPDCSLFLHKPCAESGNYRFFQFFLRADCPFKFEERTLLCKCYICSEEIDDRHILSHSQNVNLHISCAAQTFCYIDEGASVVIQPSFHKHPTFICPRSGEEENSTCSACDRPVDGLAYICLLDECSILLHKSCAELQMEIKHSFHPQHPLSLLTVASKEKGDFDCGACSKRSAGFAYSCSKCEFYADTLCASENPSFKHPLHEHNLTYFKDTLFDLTCNVCSGACKLDFYRCVSCNFHLHRSCAVLPATVKHKDHLHMLVLRDRYVEDDSGEYYCDICSGRRNPDLGAYVCDDCDYVIAHITCALSASMLKLKISDDLALSEADKEIASLLKEMEAIDAEINELKMLLAEAKEERATLCPD